jgi:hypothetical protein
MVTGHLAIAYLARARWTRATLLPLLVASIVPDLADFALPQGDQCRTACGLYTHAVPAVFVLAAGAAFLSWEIFHRRATTYLVAGLVLVHVSMDLLTGYKPYWPGGPRLGAQLYAHPVADFAVEAALVIGAWIALRRTPDAPRAAVHPVTLLLLLLLQGGFNYWQARGS